ncbi:MAG: hypothetical protein COT14_03270 [Candidatus Diapherotrites archaeon CG08_land_8_20_14_0_20_30_16]|nr:MAG: hypothetical protein COT14_03270 [Candidatus Diapherotrites archaeon CG08_land_8_20_14_0_20_30_16]
MGYDYLIWANWSPVYLWFTFFVIVILYITFKNKLGLENFTDKKLKIFVFCVLGFLIYYIFLYNTNSRIFQNFFIQTPSIVPQTLGPNAYWVPITNTTYVVFFGLLLFLLYLIFKKKQPLVCKS